MEKRKIKLADLEAGFKVIEDWVKYGLPKGISTGWNNLDPYFTILKGQLNIVSGFPSSGKSEWVENIACNMAKKEKWKILFYSPESYPTERHTLNLLEKISGKPLLDGRYNVPKMTDDDLYDAQYVVQKHFDIISADDDPYSFVELLDMIEARIITGEKIDMVILDPWNEMESSRPSNQNETDYIGECLMMARRLARRLDVSFWIVCHPAKPAKKNKSGKYDPPDMYDLAGSANWYNKSDNSFIVHRYDLSTTRVHIFIKKIKVSHYGKPGEVFFNFDPTCSRYIPASEEF